MLWRDASVNKLGAIICSLLSLLLLTIATPTALHAANTTVDVFICNPNTTAQLTLDTPPSDSVTSHPTVAITGHASYASQIEVYVNDGYSKTIALANGITAFSTDLRLSPGTHTVTLTAIDICHSVHDTKHVVITYQPPTKPQPDPQPLPYTHDSSRDQQENYIDGPMGSATAQPGAITHGHDIPTDLPKEPNDHTPERQPPWPLSYASPDPLSFLIRAIIAFIGALLLSIRRRHVAKLFKQSPTVKWPTVLCIASWVVGALLVLFAIFGYIF